MVFSHSLYLFSLLLFYPLLFFIWTVLCHHLFVFISSVSSPQHLPSSNVFSPLLNHCVQLWIWRDLGRCFINSNLLGHPSHHSNRSKPGEERGREKKKKRDSIKAYVSGLVIWLWWPETHSELLPSNGLLTFCLDLIGCQQFVISVCVCVLQACEKTCPLYSKFTF